MTIWKELDHQGHFVKGKLGLPIQILPTKLVI
jgi:hypothetical protein